MRPGLGYACGRGRSSWLEFLPGPCDLRGYRGRADPGSTWRGRRHDARSLGLPRPGSLRFGGSAVGDVGFGDVGFGDLGLGDLGLGDVGLGDLGLGDLGLGDLGLGDLGLGDVGLGGRRPSRARPLMPGSSAVASNRTVAAHRAVTWRAWAKPRGTGSRLTEPGHMPRARMTRRRMTRRRMTGRRMARRRMTGRRRARRRMARRAVARRGTQPGSQVGDSRLAQRRRGRLERLGARQRHPGGVVVGRQHVPAALIEDPLSRVQASVGDERQLYLPAAIAELLRVPLRVFRIGAEHLRPVRSRSRPAADLG